jgi:homoserine kinase
MVANALGKTVKITIHRSIPLSSGLGSSAAPAAGVAVALNLMYDLGLSNDELVQFAAHGEKAASGVEHADNVAPAICGGFTIVHKNKVISLMPENIGIVVVHPGIVVSTRTARALLPEKMRLEDVSFNTGSAASMVVGMMKNDVRLIGESMDNRVIEQARSGLIKGYSQVRKSALDAGASGITISGSGPTMIAVCRMDERENIAQAMIQAFRDNQVKSEAFITTIGKGAEILQK